MELLVVGCTLEDWSRSIGRTGSISTDFNHAQTSGANQQCYRPYVYSLIALEWDGHLEEFHGLFECPKC